MPEERQHGRWFDFFSFLSSMGGKKDSALFA